MAWVNMQSTGIVGYDGFYAQFLKTFYRGQVILPLMEVGWNV